MVLSRMEEGNVTNNLRELFPHAKVGCKIGCEASPLEPFFATNITDTEAYS